MPFEASKIVIAVKHPTVCEASRRIFVSPTPSNAAFASGPALSPGRLTSRSAGPLRTWMEEWSGCDATTTSSSSSCRSSPPSTSSCYLPASLDDRQAAACRPAAARRAPLLPGRRSTVFSPAGLCRSPHRRRDDLHGGRPASSPPFISSSLVSAVLQLPFETYGENGQTSSHQSNFPAADPRRPQVAAGKPAQAALPPRRRYELLLLF